VAEPTLLGTSPGETSGQPVWVDGDHVVGYAYDGTSSKPTLWSAALPTNPPTVFALPTGLVGGYAGKVVGNDVVGYADNGSGQYHGMLWDASNPAAAPVEFATSGGSTAVLANSVSGNDVVGWASVGGFSRPLLWSLSSPASAPTILGLGTYTSAVPYWNDGTRIVGYADADPVLWDATSPTAAPTALAVIPGSTFGLASMVQGDDIIGYCYDGATFTPCLWDATNPTAQPTILGTLAGAGYASPYGIKGGLIVGEVDTDSPNPVVWSLADPTAAPTVLARSGNSYGDIPSADGSAVYGVYNDLPAVWVYPPPVPPLVQIKVAGVDQASHVVFARTDFESAVNGAVGNATVYIRDDDSSMSFVTGSDLELLINGDPVWTGFITAINWTYPFPAQNPAAFGSTRFFKLTGTDLNILFSRRIVFNQSDGADVLGTLFPAHTADTTAIADLIANFLDLSSDSLDTSTLVENVADINEDQEARAWEGSDQWGQAMSSIAMLPAAVYFLDPLRRLVYTDVNTANAPFGMSDQPSAEQVGYREMRLLRDGGGLINDLLAWGMGYGSNTPVFKRETDATSLATHGRWQTGITKSGIYKQATIDRVASSYVYGSPSSQRGAKDDRVSVEIVTYESGFLPAQKVAFESNVFGFSDTIPIRRMKVTFEGPDVPRYELLLSHAIDDPWGFFDPFLLNFRFPPFNFGGFPLPVLPPLPTACTLQACWVNPPVVLDDFARIALDDPGSTSWGCYRYQKVSTDTTFSSSQLFGAPFTNPGPTPFGIDGEMHCDTPPGCWTANARWQMDLPITNLSNTTLEFDLYASTDTDTGVGFTGMLAQILFGFTPWGGGSFGFSIGDEEIFTGTTPFHTQQSYFQTPDGYKFTGVHNGWASGVHVAVAAVDIGGGDIEITMTVGVNSHSFTRPVTADATTQRLSMDFKSNVSGGAYAPYGSSHTAIKNLKITTDAGNCTVVTQGDPNGSTAWIGPNGQSCALATRTSATVYATPYPFVPNSTLVWRDGLLQNRGTDYTEGTDNQSLVFTTDVDVSSWVRACYSIWIITG
jgi:hypothetical protein